MIRQIFLMVCGIFLLLLGITGLILPILPGWPFVFFGLSMVAPAAAFHLKYKWTQALLKKDIVYFSEWKKSGVDAGITTKFFPFYPHKTDEMGIESRQKEFGRVFSESRVIVSQKIVPDGRFAWLHQVHGAKVAVLDRAEEYKAPGFHRLEETDGVITNIPGLTLLAMTADCLSVYFRVPGWVGVVHAGWRGTASEIALEAVRLLLEKSGCQPSDIHVIFGPSICGKHYQVGPEFTKYFSAPPLKHLKAGYYLNLVRENTRQLRKMGVLAKHISDTALCTVSENRHFYSFRLEKEAAARMISFIRLRA